MLAGTASAVGLSNLWNFPIIVGSHGGGAFLLTYLLCLLLLGIPLVMAELVIGRMARQNPICAIRDLAFESGAGRLWRLIGWTAALAALLVLVLYSVIAGWGLAYFVRMSTGVFDGVTVEGAASIFSELAGDAERLLAWHTLFIGATTVVVAHGIRHGLQRAFAVLVPVIFLLLIVLVLYAVEAGDIGAGLGFLFQFNPGFLTQEGVIAAISHAFFSLSLGVAVMIAYGAYLPNTVSITRVSVMVVVMDTLAALLAGLIVLPILFGNGLAISPGPALLFQNLPVAFGRMQTGYFFGTLFFLLVLLLAWSSAISLFEPAVSWLVEARRCSRPRAAVRVGVLVWTVGIVIILSFSEWQFSFIFAGALRHNGLYDLFEIVTAGFMLPIGAVAVALFVGWALSRVSLQDALGLGDTLRFRFWYFLLRYFVPLAVLVIVLKVVGIV
ncbi:MAG: sodium-dependent transporter [Gammaproteobacteria bacterium]|nr:sodium-dependent transporter [Gammaproteobacteria bacterium]